MSITQTQAFLVNFSNLRPGKGLGLGLGLREGWGHTRVYVANCSRERPVSV